MVFAAVVLAFLSYEIGQRSYRSTDSGGAYLQAMLAFSHYKSYERLERLLEHRCFESAILVAKEMKKLQVVLLSENLRATGNHHELLEYVGQRDRPLLDGIMAGRVPKLEPYATASTEPGYGCK